MLITITDENFSVRDMTRMRINNASSSFMSRARRTTVTRLLNGGVYVYDGGLSHEDRQVSLDIMEPTDSLIADLLARVEASTPVIVVIGAELFSCLLDSVSVAQDATVGLLIKERII